MKNVAETVCFGPWNRAQVQVEDDRQVRERTREMVWRSVRVMIWEGISPVYSHVWDCLQESFYL